MGGGSRRDGDAGVARIGAFSSGAGDRRAGAARRAVGGEAWSDYLAVRRVRSTGEASNLYGPTETCVWALRHPLQADDPRPLLGSPFDNTRAHVLDAELNPMPVGVAGELYIGGGGLARGYLGRADFTAERFAPDPFRADGARLYRTGDLARRRADGRIEFIGRVDHQIEISRISDRAGRNRSLSSRL